MSRRDDRVFLVDMLTHARETVANVTGPAVSHSHDNPVSNPRFN